MKNQNGHRAAMLAAQFKQKAQAARMPIDLPVPLATDPDFVFPCVVRRVDVVTLATAPKAGLPDHFVRSILGLKKPEELAELEAEANQLAVEQAQKSTLEDVHAMQRFIRKVAQETCLEPRIVFSAKDSLDTVPEDAIDLDDPDLAHCADEIITALYNYGMRMSPDTPVKTTGGETTLKAVETFRDRAGLSDAGDDSAQLSPAPI